MLTTTALLAERQPEESSAAMAENCANDDGAGREAALLFHGGDLG